MSTRRLSTQNTFFIILAALITAILLPVIPIVNLLDYPFRLLMTIVHELGHGVAALITGVGAAIHLGKRFGGCFRVVCVGVPQDVAAAVGLPEHTEKEIPLALTIVPRGERPLLLCARDKLASNASELTGRLRDRNLRTHRMASKRLFFPQPLRPTMAVIPWLKSNSVF